MSIPSAPAPEPFDDPDLEDALDELEANAPTDDARAVLDAMAAMIERVPGVVG